MAGSEVGWAIVVPVKRLVLAKTRLVVTADLRPVLALAMAVDTVQAALRCARVVGVVAVTDDEGAQPLLVDAGAVVTADEPDSGLNPALVHGAEIATRTFGTTAVAALSSDLPALRAEELAVVLAAAQRPRLSMVGDWSGTGTTLLAARTADAFAPAYGPDSRAAHRRQGAVDLTAIAGASVRHDVDTTDDLRAVAELGCGEATAAVLASHPELIA